MFAISLVLVAVISTAVLLYQYYSGALAPGEQDSLMPELRPDQLGERVAPPARAA